MVRASNESNTGLVKQDGINNEEIKQILWGFFWEELGAKRNKWRNSENCYGKDAIVRHFLFFSFLLLCSF